jgi:SagB-type dehydrogenase family enzyme
MDLIKQYRNFLKANFDAWGDVESDQRNGLPNPALEKPVIDSKQLISLPQIDKTSFQGTNLTTAILNRESIRKYKDVSMSLLELSYLLYTTHGVQKIFKNGIATKRTVPSGGARHPFETYLAIFNVEGLKPGIYHYLGLSHKLEYLFDVDNLSNKLSEGAFEQSFVSKGNVTFIWSAIPYRSEWRYHISAHKTLLLDAGHICQNLYLACEAIDCGTVAIAAYDQKKMDALLRLDGEDEFVVYLAPVGKKF